jgi:iron complex outermembrane receptor protein
MQKLKNLYSIGTFAVITLFLNTSLVFGADDEAYLMEEIIVSAERKEEGIQSVPVSITAFSGDNLRSSEIYGVEGIALRVPGMVFNQQDQAESFITMRGIGTESAQDAAGESSVAMYIDDVYIGRQGAGNFDLFDLERVEVLRGPQGTLFGRNASGGVVHFITSKPKDEFEGRAQVKLGDYNLIDIRSMVTGPISETSAYKLAMSSHNRDGYVMNLGTGNDNDDKQATSVRGSIRNNFSDTLEMIVSYDVTRERGLSSAKDTEDLKDSASYMGGIHAITDPRPRYINAVGDGKRERDLDGWNVTFTKQLENSVFTSITAKRNSEFDTRWYFAGNPLTDNTIESLNTNKEDSSQFSQEFRLSGSRDKLDWIAGFYYFDMETDRLESFDQHFNGLFGAVLGLPGGFGNGFAAFTQHSNIDSTAIFAQMTYQATDKLALTAGVRSTEETRSLTVNAVQTKAPGAVTVVGLNESYYIDVSKDWSATTPKFGLEYQISDNQMMYWSATNGFKAGAFSGTAASKSAALAPLEPEDVWNYELGSKNTLLDNRLRLNVAIFSMDYEDLQTSELIPGAAIIRANAQAKIDGFEVESLYLVTDNFSAGINYSNLDAKYTEYKCAAGDCAGNFLPRSPENTLSLSLAYETNLGSNLMSWELDYFDSAEQYYEPSNPSIELQPSFDYMDARVSIKNPDGDWRITVWAKNMDDSVVMSSAVGVGSLAQRYVTYTPPKTYGITFVRNF